MSEAVTAFPLAWPSAWPRARYRDRARFSSRNTRGQQDYVSVHEARGRLQRELDMLGGAYPTLSTNVELRLDGLPRSGQAEPRDTGAAIYFRLNGKPIVLACDRWDRVADNIVALAKHIEAMRGMERWGVGTASQAFAGYQALPSAPSWREVLGLSGAVSRSQVDAAYREKAKDAHPDRGGSREAWDRLSAAYEAAKLEATS